VVALSAMVLFGSLPVVLTGYALVGLVSVGLGGSLLAGLCKGQIRLEGHPDQPPATAVAEPSLLQAATNVGPFALMTMFYGVYFQGPVAVLEWLRGGQPAGVYNASFLVIAAISLIPTVIYMRLLLPRICRWAEHDRVLFNAAFQVGVPAMALLGLACMAFVMGTASWLLPLLFGPSYSEGVIALTVRALSIPVRFVQTVYSSLFVSERDMLRKSGYLGGSALIGLAASLLLVAYAGLVGAAIATVSAELVLLILHVVGASLFIQGIAVIETLRLATFRAALSHLLRAHTAA
jgi:O-antigen/teichoic acid export membrane protein